MYPKQVPHVRVERLCVSMQRYGWDLSLHPTFLITFGFRAWGFEESHKAGFGDPARIVSGFQGLTAFHYGVPVSVSGRMSHCAKPPLEGRSFQNSHLGTRPETQTTMSHIYVLSETPMSLS